MKKRHGEVISKTGLIIGLLSLSLVAIAGQAHAAIQCYDCHGDRQAGILKPKDTYIGAPKLRDEATGAFLGNHQTHLGVVPSAADCVKCHNNQNYTNSHASTGNFKIKINPKLNNFSTSLGAAKYGKPTSFDQTSVPVTTTCSNVNCHFVSKPTDQWGTGPYASATMTTCNKCHDALPASNAHTKHISRYGNDLTSCVKCHTDHTSEAKPFQHATSAGRPIMLSFTYTGSNNRYLPGQTGRVVGDCSNLYCHSDGSKSSGYTSKSAGPSWSGGQMSCTSCHGGPLGSGAFKTISTGRHTKHLATPYNFGCAVCHAATVSSNSVISDQAKHVNTQIDISFSGLAKSGGANALYTNSGHAPGQPGTVNDSCQNVYCHSNAQVGGQAGTQLRFRNLTGAKRFSQTTTVSLGCNGCHSTGTTISGQWILSGKHLAHVSAVVNPAIGKALACADCHANGGSSLGKANHSNGFVNYSGALSGNPASLTFSTGVCATAYCHSDGRGNLKSMATDNWFSATNLDCTGCHGGAGSQAGEPVYTTGNSHAKHVGTTGANATCQNCHGSTVTGTALSATTTHVNKSIEVVAGNGKSFAFAAGTCSNISCHGAGSPSATWGGGATMDCEGCHPSLNLSAGHGIHISSLLTERKATLAYSTYSANASTDTAYKFGCANCHPVNIAMHVNGTVDVDLATTAGSGTLKGNNPGSAVYDMAGTKQCSNVYCHSNGYATNLVYAQSPAWTGNFAGDRCAGCHGNSPSSTIVGSPAHSAHAVGIHYDDIFDGVSGKYGYYSSATRASAHGDPNQATIISCDICHTNTVATAAAGKNANDKNSICVTCHSTTSRTPALKRMAHINGTVDVKFASVNVRSKAQIRETSFSSYTSVWSRTSYKVDSGSYDTAKKSLTQATFTAAGVAGQGTCATVSCHNGYTVKWNDSLTCESCHSRL